jgi:hypothetical protein
MSVSAAVAVISENELIEMEQRLREATPGPWRSMVEGRDHESGSSFILTGSAEMRGPDLEVLGASRADLDFIAACRQDVPKLIACIRALRTK